MKHHRSHEPAPAHNQSEQRESKMKHKLSLISASSQLRKLCLCQQPARVENAIGRSALVAPPRAGVRPPRTSQFRPPRPLRALSMPRDSIYGPIVLLPGLLIFYQSSRFTRVTFKKVKTKLDCCCGRDIFR